jgi:hypothetical protein
VSAPDTLANGNALDGTVVKAIYQGNANQLRVSVADGEAMIVDVSGRTPFEAGEKVTLRFAASDAWLLPA